jgi:hypothetical protein
MQARATETPLLRLVRPPAAKAFAKAPAQVPKPSADPEHLPRVPSESPLTATDPRWVFAVRVLYTLQGGKAAILRPKERRYLLHLAGYLHLRPFDANLIIAVVQDAVRTGEAASLRARLGPEVAERLALMNAVRPGAEPSPRQSPTRLLLASGLLAAVLLLGAIRWLVGA